MHSGEYLPPKGEQGKTETWHKAWKYFEEQVPEAKDALEDEFRNILGLSAIADETDKSLSLDAE